MTSQKVQGTVAKQQSYRIESYIINKAKVKFIEQQQKSRMKCKELEKEEKVTGDA